MKLRTCVKYFCGLLSSKEEKRNQKKCFPATNLVGEVGICTFVWQPRDQPDVGAVHCG